MITEKNPTVLYIDDDRDDLQIMQEALTTINKDFQMLPAHNGKEGLEQLHEMKQRGNLPCLIVLDINMPVMNGKETFLKIKEDKTLSQIPVVIFSTSANANEKGFFQGEKVTYITKPLSFSLLIEVARQLINYC